MIDVAHPPTDFAVLRRFRRGALILVADTPAETVHLVRRGQARVYVLDDAGNETTTCVLGPGQVLGVAPLVGCSTYHTFVEALTPVEAWAMPSEAFLAHLPHDHELLWLVVHALTRRIVLADTLLRGVTLLPVAERIADALTNLSLCLGGEQPRLTRETLAGLVGARRETVSRSVNAIPRLEDSAA
jgi:CRP/FNR family transcriptional regulator